MEKLTNRLNSTDTIKPITRLFFTECCIRIVFIMVKDKPIQQSKGNQTDETDKNIGETPT